MHKDNNKRVDFGFNCKIMEFFKYCTLDNPVFQSAIFWIGLFIFTGCFTIYYKIQEAQEAAEAEKLKKETPKSEEAKP